MYIMFTQPIWAWTLVRGQMSERAGRDEFLRSFADFLGAQSACEVAQRAGRKETAYTEISERVGLPQRMTATTLSRDCRSRACTARNCATDRCWIMWRTRRAARCSCF